MGTSHYTCRDNESPVQIRILRACRLSLIARYSTLSPRVRRRFQLDRNRMSQPVSQPVSHSSSARLGRFALLLRYCCFLNGRALD
jgi:hypothetical protein